MKHARVEVDMGAASRSETGLVIAGLRLRVGEYAFPDEAWTDFVVVILAWWAQAAVRLLSGESGSIEVRFMDGPHTVELARISAQVWHVRLVEVGLRRHIRDEADVDVGPLVGSVVESCETTLATCHQRRWWSGDADELEAITSRLRAEVNRFRD